MYEDALEGSLSHYGTDLADLYRNRLTLRQLWVRIKALPGDCWLWREVREELEREKQVTADDIDEALSMFVRPKEG